MVLGLELEPPPKLGCSSLGVVRGSEWTGLLPLPKVEFAGGKLGENPWPKLTEFKATAAANDNVVPTRVLRSEE